MKKEVVKLALELTKFAGLAAVLIVLLRLVMA